MNAAQENTCPPTNILSYLNYGISALGSPTFHFLYFNVRGSLIAALNLVIAGSSGFVTWWGGLRLAAATLAG